MEFALPGSDGFYFWWRGSFLEGNEMSKELPYFRFTAFEWLNDDISLEDYQTKGVFIDVCAYYWFKDCSITKAMLEKRFSTVMPVIELLFESGIIKFRNGDDFIEISFLNKQFDELSELRKQRQSAGSKGGKQRASKAKAKLKQNPSYKDKDKDKEDIYGEFYNSEIEKSNGDENYLKVVKMLHGENNLGIKLDVVLKIQYQLTYEQFKKLWYLKGKYKFSFTEIFERIQDWGNPKKRKTVYGVFLTFAQRDNPDIKLQ